MCFWYLGTCIKLVVVQYAGITLMATLLKETVSLSTRAVEHLLVQDMAETKYFLTRHIQIFVAHVILYVCVATDMSLI